MWCVAGATRDSGRPKSTMGIMTKATYNKILIVKVINFLVLVGEGGTYTQRYLPRGGGRHASAGAEQRIARCLSISEKCGV